MFKKSVIISILGHFALFSVFNLSFGKVLFKMDRPAVYFWGKILSTSDINNITPTIIREKKSLITSTKTLFAFRESRGLFIDRYYVKPQAVLNGSNAKIDFMPGPLSSQSVPLSRKESVVMLHPQLPYYFKFLFKDRESVHLELQFNIVTSEKRKYIVIKRKLSSGSLEADLLSMRYIGHYLSIQNKRFFPNSWQTIKIELSVRDSERLTE